MGSSGKEGDSFWKETPRHQVRVSPFLIGQVPVTQRQWRVVAGWDRNEKLDLGASNPALSHLAQRELLRVMSKEKLDPDPSRFKGEKLPVEGVSWEQAVRFCAILSAKTGRQYRLPTEAEWEYSCRAGTDTPFAFGETVTPEYVNYDGNYPYAKAPKGEYRGTTTPVGSLKAPNAWGLYDMHGNVWEWCQDWTSDEYYEECHRQGVVSDPQGPATGSSRVLRGGGWYRRAVLCRSAIRSSDAPGYRSDDLGFRLVRVGP
jgi:formylglycine-generating enzyme required for sulfatase activity